jgi:mannosyl-3-phosphoglycerate phosphatase
MEPKLPVVVYSDDIPLDGARSSAMVAYALELITSAHIPLILCSGKTRAEIELLQQELGIRHPFISENGGAVFVPRGYFGIDVPNATDVAGYEAVTFGRPYAEVVGVLRRTADRQRVDLIGFNDMSVEEVANDCDLSLMQARLAKLREYEEPFRMLADDPGARNRLVRALRREGLGCTGGMPYDRVGAPVDGGVGVQLLIQLFRRAFGSLFSVGLGCGMSAVPLLRRMDVPLIIDRDDPSEAWSVLVKVPTARITSRTGTDGWADAIIETVDAIRQHGRLPVPAQRNVR